MSLFADHILGPDTHANRPASAKKRSVYVCTTHSLLYYWDGAAWQTWFSYAGASSSTLTTKGDLLTFDGSALVRVGVGSNNQVPAADSAQSAGLKWVEPGSTKNINAQTGTSYTLVLGDAGKFITMTNASASTLTVPPNSSVAFPVGTVIEGAQLGAGQVTLTQGSGVTIQATPGLKIAAQYGTFGLLKTATDTWLAYGRLSA